ncbi:MAG: acyl-CoA dehydrogenase family protein [Thermoanaerobaculia bacterium]
MNFLKKERAALETALPALDAALAGLGLAEMEKPGNPAIGMFRERGGPGLLIPVEHGGVGAAPLDALRVQFAVGSRAPSLAIATTMHHFSVATIVEMVAMKLGSGFEWMLLEAIAKQKLLVASGFAEGRSGASIMSSFLQVERSGDGFVVNGSKKPCSLAHSMDLLTASMLVARRGGEPELAVAIIPSRTPGIERRPFWTNPILAGAESDEVHLENVAIQEKLVSYLGSPGQLDALQSRGFLWFELLISASYLGIAAGLAERVIQAGKGGAGERAELAIEIVGALSALEGVACAMARAMAPDNAAASRDELARALFVRYTVQRAIRNATSLAVELLGGMAFIGSAEPSYLYAAAHCLVFHPPGRVNALPALARYLDGEPLVI